MSKIIAAEKGKIMVFRYRWEQLLIIPFNITEKVQEAVVQVERWIVKEEVDWLNDSARKRIYPSYLIIACYENRIQGPVVYILFAGASDELDVSVKEWNKSREEKCVRIRFQDFREQKIRRRTGMLTFLYGFFDVGCLCWARVYKVHQQSELELREQRAEF